MTRSQTAAEHLLARDQSNGHYPAPHRTEGPQPLGEEAFHGIAGDIVRAIDPHTESDPAALLFQFLAAFGSAVGRSPHALAEDDRHGANIFICLVGETSKGRKGTSWGRIYGLFQAAGLGWAESNVQSGLSSGEGLIHAVRDAGMGKVACLPGQCIIIIGFSLRH